MSPKKDAYMRGYVDGFNDAKRILGETGMVLGTGRERPLCVGGDAGGYPEARFETASLHQSHGIWPNWGDRPDGFDGPTGAE
jgi:hypothetical protein